MPRALKVKHKDNVIERAWVIPYLQWLGMAALRRNQGTSDLNDKKEPAMLRPARKVFWEETSTSSGLEVSPCTVRLRKRKTSNVANAI